MGIDFNSLKKKAKEALEQNSGKIEQGLDKASGFAKSKMKPEHAEKIDKATGKAKEALHKNDGGDGKPGEPGSPGPTPGPTPTPPPAPPL